MAGKRYTKREYHRWTEDEIKALRENRRPPGRDELSCKLKAKYMGIPWASAKGRTKGATWTNDELIALRKHEVPEGRTLCACYSKAWSLGLKFRNRTKKTGVTDEQVEALKQNRVPDGMSMKRARTVASLMRIPFHPVQAARREARMARCKEVYDMKFSGMTYREIGEKLGVSRQRVHGLMMVWVNHLRDEIVNGGKK